MSNATLSQVYSENLNRYYVIAADYVKANGIGWYAQAHQDCKDLAEKYNITLEQSCAIVAALSPRVAWAVNVACAEKCIIAWMRGLQPTDIHIEAFRANRAKAWAILDNPHHDPKTYVGKPKTAPKVRAFYECLLNPLTTREVCIDSWMARAATNDMGRTAITPKEFQAIAHEVALLADSYGIPPLVMQAIIWESVRVLGSLDTP